MSIETMSNPFETFKKLKNRNWEELRARGGQALSVYSEQIGLSGKLPTDSEFQMLFDRSQFGGDEIAPGRIFEKFFENSLVAFFPSFAEREKTLELFRRFFGEKSAPYFIEKADRAIDGKFDLLGYTDLDFGVDVSWHLEPVSGKVSPLKHWKQFDELDTRETGDKKIVWELNRHQHFFALGVAYWLTDDERYAKAFAGHLTSWMEQNPPGTGINWLSSMEIAFRSISWIWAFNFFKRSEHFTPGLFRDALKFLFLHGRHIEKYLSTYYSPNTHLTGEALGLYYLGTQLPFFNRAAHWRRLGEEILFAELDRQILPDGVYFEHSSWYQRYTASFYTHFLILKTLAGDGAPPSLQEKLSGKTQSLLDFLMCITRPDGTTPLIGDDDGGQLLPQSRVAPNDFRGILSTGAVLFERGDYKFAAGRVAEETVWLLGLEGALAFDTLESRVPERNSVEFKDGGYYIMREGWTDTDNYMLIDAGNLGALSGGHSHADTLAIELAAGGRSLLIDPGTYTYHESKELRDYFRSSGAHNTLVIDGESSSEPGGKFGWETKAETAVSEWIAQERFDFFEASHDGYERLPGAPARHTRSVVFLKNDYWIMRDFVETAGAHDYCLNFNFSADAQPEIAAAENGGFCVSERSSSGSGFRIFTFDHGEWVSEKKPVSTVYGEKINSHFMKFVSKGTGAQEFFSFMLPVAGNFSMPEVFETAIAGGRAFVIKYRDYSDLFVFADGDRVVRTEFFNTNFRFSWARLSAGERLPEEFVLIDGSEFTTGGREILSYPARAKFAVARRFGSKLNVRTPSSLFSVSLPQKRTATYVLKNSDDYHDI